MYFQGKYGSIVLGALLLQGLQTYTGNLTKVYNAALMHGPSSFQGLMKGSGFHGTVYRNTVKKVKCL